MAERLRCRVPPPVTFIQAYYLFEVARPPSGVAWYMTDKPVTPCTITYYNVQAGDFAPTSEVLEAELGIFPVPDGDAIISLDEVTVIPPPSPAWGNVWERHPHFKVDVPGFHVGLRFAQGTIFSCLINSTFSILPWVEGVAPFLCRAKTIPERAVVPLYHPDSPTPPRQVVLSSRLIRRPYIVEELEYAAIGTADPSIEFAPYVAHDTDIQITDAEIPIRSQRPGEPLLTRGVAHGSPDLWPGRRIRAVAGVNRIRPYKNVRFVPSALKIHVQKVSGVDLWVRFHIRYLKPVPWWRDPNQMWKFRLVDPFTGRVIE